MLVRDEISARGLRHRRGFRLSDESDDTTIGHLCEEVLELGEAVSRGNVVDAREEAADVFACVLQIAARLGMSFADLDLEAERKLRLRFIGAKDIPDLAKEGPPA